MSTGEKTATRKRGKMRRRMSSGGSQEVLILEPWVRIQPQKDQPSLVIDKQSRLLSIIPNLSDFSQKDNKGRASWVRQTIFNGSNHQRT